MTTIAKKLPAEYGTLELGNFYVEEIWLGSPDIIKAVGGKGVALWDSFALGWAISKGVPLPVAQAFVKRYSGCFYPKNEKDAA